MKLTKSRLQQIIKEELLKEAGGGREAGSDSWKQYMQQEREKQEERKKSHLNRESRCGQEGYRKIMATGKNLVSNPKIEEDLRDLLEDIIQELASDESEYHANWCHYAGAMGDDLWVTADQILKCEGTGHCDKLPEEVKTWILELADIMGWWEIGWA